MKRRRKKLTPTILAISLLSACGGNGTEEMRPASRMLPYYGNHDVQLIEQPDGSMLADTVYFSVPPFSFTDLNEKEVSHHTIEGHVYIADFFFTTCPTICPIMSSQLSRLQSKLQKEGFMGDVHFISHSVNPETDTPDVLRDYALRLDADTTTWHFVTGDKDLIYDQARYGYFMTALESDTAAGGFFHSDTFVLIDQERHIRGYYDGTSTYEVDSLFNDILLLHQRP